MSGGADGGRSGGPARRTLAEAVLGVAGGAMVLVAVVLLFVGGEGDTGAVEEAAPRIELLQPQDGARIEGDLHLVFRVAGELTRRPGGWGVGSHHLHLELDELEVMPGPQDVERLPSGHYRWSLPRPPAGSHRIRLYWSDPDHRPIRTGASIPVEVRVP